MMPVERKRKIGTAIYTKLAITLLISLFVFVTVRGISSNYSQEKLKLEKEVHSLASSNEWIKYEINDKISLENLEAYSVGAGMAEAKKEQIEVIPVDKTKIDPPPVVIEEVKEESFFDNIKRTIGEFFNGQ